MTTTDDDQPTAAAPSHDDDDTTAVPADLETQAAEFAWSQTDQDDALPDDGSRGSAFWPWAYAGTMLAVVIVLGGLLWFVLSDKHEVAVPPAAPSTTPVLAVPHPSAAPPSPAPTPTATVTVTTTPAPPPPTASAAPASTPDTEAQDLQFISILQNHHITASQGGAAEVRAGRLVCRSMSYGQTPDRIAFDVQQANPGFSAIAARFVVDTAIAVYCPQYKGM